MIPAQLLLTYKRTITPGVYYIKTNAGSDSFVMPDYNTARLEVVGGGAGAGATNNATGAPVNSSNAGDSSCTSTGINLSAQGGRAATGGGVNFLQTQGPAATASGGNVANTNGQVANNGEITAFGSGLGANSSAGVGPPDGSGTGGASVFHGPTDGGTPGISATGQGAGGGGNASGNTVASRARGTAGGNSGAYARSDFTFGAVGSPLPGATFNVTVGAGSAGATSVGNTAGSGTAGYVRLTVLS